jgi:transcriptional regulator with XRE-family HTH domain
VTYPREYSDGWPGSPEEFGRQVQATRKALGLSRPALAKLAELSPFTLRNIERGFSGTSPDKRARLLAVLTAASGQAEPREQADSDINQTSNSTLPRSPIAP